MHKQFENLFVSSPNDGGLFLLHKGDTFLLDDLDTTGFSCFPSGVLRGLQPSELCIYTDTVRYVTGESISFSDVHDVHYEAGFYYLVGTSGNEILQLTEDGEEVQRWVFPGEEDSCHINCLATWNGRIVFSAFGDFREHRGYKGNTKKSGFVQDLLTGERLITGLSQPHSLVPFGNNLLIANSENMEICEFSITGDLLRLKSLGRYARGICVGKHAVYVGLSGSRNIQLSGLDSAEIVSFDLETLEEIGRISLPTREIYAIQRVDDKDELIRAISLIASSSSAKLTDSLSRRDGQIGSLNQAVSERDGQIGSLNQAVSERDGQIGSLNQQLKSIMESRSWKLSAPLRQLSTFAHNIPATLFRRAITTYHTLPITPLQRQKLKNLVFSIFGFAFTRMDAYQRWKEYRHIQMDWPAKEQITKAAPVNSMIPGIIASLPSADGRWEWSDYTSVKSRISLIKAQQLSQVTPTPLDTIDISNESFASAAARVKLPAPIAAPDISIILPVFNNLKLTLECLLSIAAYSDPDISYEIIVADDASTDETAEIIGSIPHLYVIRNDSNLGFLRNCNNSLKHVQGNYVLYLNNDVQVTSGWLSSLLCTFNTHPKVGAVGPRFVYPSGHLQEAGAAFRPDGTADMVGLNGDSTQERFSYVRRVDYVSGACLMLPTILAKQLKGFSEEFLPCYCEDSDMCLSIQQAGYFVYYNPAATIVHHLSKTTAAIDNSFKFSCITKNLVTLQKKWHQRLEQSMTPKVIAFYLPQFHPVPENNKWWGNGFTEWTNVTKAKANFVGHYQPRIPSDLGYYDLRLTVVMEQQAELARRYGVGGFCYYYYWFDGKRLLDVPIEQMLETGKPDFPFCVCWANENWTRRWDGMDQEILMSQSHSEEDDSAVILDLIRFFRDQRYIRVDDRPLILVYRITLFPNFAETAARWRNICREQGIGEIYIAMVESMEMVHSNKLPKEYGCDAAVEFPPQGLAEQKQPDGDVINPDFAGSVADYRDLAVRFATREAPAYTRFKAVMPGWDNTARRQNDSFCFEHATPGAFQAWLEETIEQTRMQQYGDERLIFVNAWNEWAEGAYLEPDRRFGHTYLEAVRNALDAASLLRKNKHVFGDNEE